MVECEYELARQRNIKRNQELLKSLGLNASDFSLHKQQDVSPKKPSPKRKATATNTQPPSPKRRSGRLRGEGPELGGKGDSIEWSRAEARREREESQEGFEVVDAEVEARHRQEEREYMERWAGRQGRETIVGTASYKHTLKRVRSMSDAALSNRVKAIERAKGKYAVIKMRLFARVLCLEGKDDLAEEAVEALRRLIAVLGDPETEVGKGEELPPAGEVATQQTATQESG